MDVQIRGFETGDTEAVVDIWREVFGYQSPHSAAAVSIGRKLNYQPELFFVAEGDGRVVGTVMAGYDGHRGWIYSLSVCPRVQTQGVGSLLLQHAEAELRKLDCVKINLQIHVQNEGVVEFYEKLGYRVEPRISMGKTLLR